MAFRSAFQPGENIHVTSIFVCCRREFEHGAVSLFLTLYHRLRLNVSKTNDTANDTTSFRIRWKSGENAPSTQSGFSTAINGQTGSALTNSGRERKAFCLPVRVSVSSLSSPFGRSAALSRCNCSRRGVLAVIVYSSVVCLRSFVASSRYRLAVDCVRSKTFVYWRSHAISFNYTGARHVDDDFSRSTRVRRRRRDPVRSTR